MDAATLISQIWNGLIFIVGLAVTGYLRSNAGRIKALEKSAAEQDIQVALLKQKSDELEKQINLHSDDMREIREKVNKIESAIAQMAVQIQAIHSAIIK